jgi:regulatory GntR family protein
MEIPHSLRALEILKAKILSSEYGPGDVISIRDAERVTRTSSIPIREALIRLAERGLIEHVERRGFIVRRPSAWEVHAALEHIALIEARVLDHYARAVLRELAERFTRRLVALADLLDAGTAHLHDIHRLLIKHELAAPIRVFGDNLIDLAQKVLDFDAESLDARERSKLFASSIRRYVSCRDAADLKALLATQNERLSYAARQLHGLTRGADAGQFYNGSDLHNRTR